LHRHRLEDWTYDSKQDDNREHGCDHNRELHHAMRMAMRMVMKRWTEILMMAAALCLTSNDALAADKYRVQELLPPSDASMTPHGLNSNGDAVGGAGLSHGGDIRVFLSQHGAAAKELQRATSSDYSEAKSINDAGQIVGSMNGRNAMRAF